MKIRGKAWIPTVILSIALIVSLIWGYNQYKLKNKYEISLSNQYQRLFYDVKKHVENVQIDLSKALLSNSRNQNVLMLSQIMSESNSAQDKLSQMPINHSDVGKTEKFLSQVADYSYYLIQTHLKGEELTSKQRETLFNLQGSSSNFNKELSEAQNKIAQSMENTTTAQLSKVEEANQSVLNTQLLNLEKEMGKSPELIYDGPFSEQNLGKKPVGLGTKKVTLKEAQKIATDFIGVKKVEEISTYENGKDISLVKIPSYTFNIVPENTSKDRAIYMGVSQKGGNVVWMSNPRAVSKVNISMKQAEQKAAAFLKEKGMENMEPNYSLKYDGVGIFNFAYKNDDVTIYSDLIKVNVALDNGEIVGYDANTYLMNHQERDIPEPKLTQAEAREKVKVDYDIDSVRLAIIPKGSREPLCYEFKGKYRGSDFIIYINAVTGDEEEILQIIKNENGTLTF
ncbi:germination protein YpeB [Acidilutibacter cellobiosedens]|jgi:spore germination protein|uniref:Germination protein YpeB n=1 Tax=Acidilutibacter cellobiosedens TaxID=2507161 RepID=A0A410Q9A7_9FIRM|nr:germination protein YpeB [Acidilutibacter cellobiosedens]QAT60573.1 germination protein YpeB [Acidilutibacter cellobiosedens]